ncbi:MAG TPA: restriction endonuclease [Chloroflexota bacterium]|nr:restriction endonuclease [Chloroflexota bacterium]
MYEVRIFQNGFRLRPVEKGASVGHGRTLITLLTAVYLLWLFVRIVSQPPWLAQLPTPLLELLRLAEIAGFITLALMWALLWRQNEKKPVTAVTPLDMEQLYALQPYEFEAYVADLFRQKGYRVKLHGRRGDNGVDLRLSQANGKEAIVQCKRYRKSVGPDIVRELYGTLMHERVAHAFLVTTADISDAARAWAQGKPMTLIDGRTLAHLAAAMHKTEGN